MTQISKDKNLWKQLSEYIKNNTSTFFIGLGLALGGAALGIKVLSYRVHPDLKRVIQLRQIIQKSYPDAQQSLQTLKIQKKVLTQYGNQKQSTQYTPQLNMLFLVITRLKIKQMNKQQQLRNPFLPPFQEGLFISQLEPSHRLLYNKFNIFKNHLLVVTKQFEAQSNQLTDADFRQSLLTLKALGGLLFFNSGPQSGSSQPHKHIQVFPVDALQLPIVKQIVEYVNMRSKTYDFQKQQIIEFLGFNFIHGLIILKSQVSLSSSKKKMHSAYKKILTNTVYKIKAMAYNILATQQFILIISRSKQKAFEQISINAVGFMGSLLFKDQQKLNKFLSLRIKPSSILQDITYPKNYVLHEQKKLQQN